MTPETQPPKNTDFIELNSVVFTFEDIHRLVGSFYEKVETDPLLKVPFESVEDWGRHVDHLTHFWWIRFGGEPYLDISYNPVEKHFFAGFNQEFLSRWLGLFQETLDRTLTPEQSGLWALIAGKMGQALSAKNEDYKKYSPFASKARSDS